MVKRFISERFWNAIKENRLEEYREGLDWGPTLMSQVLGMDFTEYSALEKQDGPSRVNERILAKFKLDSEL